MLQNLNSKITDGLFLENVYLEFFDGPNTSKSMQKQLEEDGFIAFTPRVSFAELNDFGKPEKVCITPVPGSDLEPINGSVNFIGTIEVDGEEVYVVVNYKFRQKGYFSPGQDLGSMRNATYRDFDDFEIARPERAVIY